MDEAARINHGHRPSMLQDALARRPTEIETLNGGIVRSAEGVGIPTPLNQAIVAVVEGLERSWTPEAGSARAD